VVIVSAGLDAEGGSRKKGDGLHERYVDRSVSR